MFTGLVECLGRISSVERGNRSLVLAIEPALSPFEVAIGDSVAINGVCLTLEKSEGRTLFFRAIFETVNRTTLKDLSANSVVNMERAMKAHGRLDGHIVQGHVDTMASLVAIEPAGDSLYYTFRPPLTYMKYMAEKGSVAIDGISLTIAKSSYDTFSLALIPHTIEETNLKGKRVGSSINIECDVLARYIEQLLKYGKESVPASNNDDRLMELLERSLF